MTLTRVSVLVRPARASRERDVLRSWGPRESGVVDREAIVRRIGCPCCLRPAAKYRPSPATKSEERTTDPAAVDDSNLSDFDVIQRVLLRQPAASDEFIARVACVPRIVEALNRTSGRPLRTHDVEDLAQHVLAEMLQHLREFPADGILDRWAYHFCVYSYYNRVRALRRTTTVPLDVAHDPTTATAQLDELLDIGQLVSALSELSAEQRDLVIEKAVEGRTFEEIGRRTSRSPNTLKSWYYASIERLRAKLALKFGDTDVRSRPRHRLAGGGAAP